MLVVVVAYLVPYLPVTPTSTVRNQHSFQNPHLLAFSTYSSCALSSLRQCRGSSMRLVRKSTCGLVCVKNPRLEREQVLAAYDSDRDRGERRLLL